VRVEAHAGALRQIKQDNGVFPAAESKVEAFWGHHRAQELNGVKHYVAPGENVSL